MMGDGYDGGGSWMMWVFGGLMMIGILALIGLVAWAIVTAATRAHSGPATGSATADAGGRGRTRQLLDERYARGEMTTDEYTERLHTLGLLLATAQSAPRPATRWSRRGQRHCRRSGPGLGRNHWERLVPGENFTEPEVLTSTAGPLTLARRELVVAVPTETGSSTTLSWVLVRTPCR